MKLALRILICLTLVAAVWWTFLRRKENVETLRLSASTETRLLLALDDTHTGLMDVADGAGIIVYANNAACDIFGYSTMNGLSVSEILPETMRAMHAERLRLAVQEGAPNHVAAMKCFALRKDGESIAVFVRVHISRNGVQALVNRADEVSYRDITTEKP